MAGNRNSGVSCCVCSDPIMAIPHAASVLVRYATGQQGFVYGYFHEECWRSCATRWEREYFVVAARAREAGA